MANTRKTMSITRADLDGAQRFLRFLIRKLKVENEKKFKDINTQNMSILEYSAHIEKLASEVGKILKTKGLTINELVPDEVYELDFSSPVYAPIYHKAFNKLFKTDFTFTSEYKQWKKLKVEAEEKKEAGVKTKKAISSEETDERNLKEVINNFFEDTPFSNIEAYPAAFEQAKNFFLRLKFLQLNDEQLRQIYQEFHLYLSDPSQENSEKCNKLINQFDSRFQEAAKNLKRELDHLHALEDLKKAIKPALIDSFIIKKIKVPVQEWVKYVEKTALDAQEKELLTNITKSLIEFIKNPSEAAFNRYQFEKRELKNKELLSLLKPFEDDWNNYFNAHMEILRVLSTKRGLSLNIDFITAFNARIFHKPFEEAKEGLIQIINASDGVESIRFQLASSELVRVSDTTKQEFPYASITKMMHEKLIIAYKKVNEEDKPKITELMQATTACVQEASKENLKRYTDALKNVQRISIGKTPWKKTEIAAICTGVGLILAGAVLIGLSVAGVSSGALITIAGVKIGLDLVMAGLGAVSVPLGIGIATKATLNKFQRDENLFFAPAKEFRKKMADEVKQKKPGTKS